MTEVAEARRAKLRDRAKRLRAYAEEKPHLAVALIEIADDLDVEADALGGGSPTANDDRVVC